MVSLKEVVPGWARDFTRDVVWQYRQATSGFRALPDFIIIGAQKSGTTSLYYYLNQHPQLLGAWRQEVHFFDGGLDPAEDQYEKGTAWYRGNFPLKKNINGHKKTFEVSPLYIFNPLVPERIAELVPKVKIIALLRNPTERAISHYFHESRKERESLSIYEAMLAEEKRLEPIIKRKDFKNEIFLHQSYKSRGLYKVQIDRYLKRFTRNQILLLSSEKFFGEPEETLRKVFEFVGVEAGFKIKDLEPRNVGSNRSKVDPHVYEYLNDYFRPHNQALYEMVEENYGW